MSAIDAQNRLTFRNLAVDAAVADRAPGYRALWYTFDNAADKATLVATTEETQSPLPMPQCRPSEFIKVDIVGGGRSGGLDPADFRVFPTKCRRLDARRARTPTLNGAVGRYSF